MTSRRMLQGMQAFAAGTDMLSTLPQAYHSFITLSLCGVPLV
jgi:hypothetical protein